MNRTVQFVIGMLAVVLALAAGIYGRNAYLQEVSTYQIPVPVAEIPAYTRADGEHVPDARYAAHHGNPALFPDHWPISRARSPANRLPAGLPVSNVSAVPAGAVPPGRSPPLRWFRSRSNRSRRWAGRSRSGSGSTCTMMSVGNGCKSVNNRNDSEPEVSIQGRDRSPARCWLWMCAPRRASRPGRAVRRRRQQRAMFRQPAGRTGADPDPGARARIGANRCWMRWRPAKKQGGLLWTTLAIP